MQQILDVSNRKQLFIDERWFASQQGMTLTVNPPIKTEQVLLPETPWENHGIHGYSNVMDDDGVYKMWYDAIAEGFDVKPERRALCYATSSDGIHWERPNVNVFEWEGNPNTNIVMPGANGSVMKDPNGPDEHRYKGLVIIKENDAWEESKGCICGSYDNGYYLELYLVTSPDGIHWKRQSPCALPFFHDTPEEIRQALYAPADTFDDALERPGLKLIHVNRSPFITTAKAMTEDNAAH